MGFQTPPRGYKINYKGFNITDRIRRRTNVCHTKYIKKSLFGLTAYNSKTNPAYGEGSPTNIASFERVTS